MYQVVPVLLGIGEGLAAGPGVSETGDEEVDGVGDGEPGDLDVPSILPKVAEVGDRKLLQELKMKTCSPTIAIER
jgi:hypothetical protein